MNKFAVVRVSFSECSFSKLHTDFETAKVEAERLCRKERTKFYVMEIKAQCYVPETPVKWEEI